MSSFARSGSNTYIICTNSSDRPVNPPEGTTVYETQNNLVYYYDGSAWRLRGIQTVGHTSLGGSATSMTITLPSITNGAHLIVETLLLGDTSNYVYVQPNGDTTTSNYWEQYFYGQNASVAAGQGSNVPGGRIGYTDTGSTYYAGGLAWIFDYASSKQKSIQNLFGSPLALSTSAFVMPSLTIWKSTSAITSIVIKHASGNLRAGSMVTVKAVGSM